MFSIAYEAGEINVKIGLARGKRRRAAALAFIARDPSVMRSYGRAPLGMLDVRVCDAFDARQESFKSGDVQSKRKTVKARLYYPSHDFGLPMHRDFPVADESRRLAFVRIILAPGLPLFRGTAKALAEPRQRLPKRMGMTSGKLASLVQTRRGKSVELGRRCPHGAR